MTARFGTVGGGSGNTAAGDAATVAGGDFNRATAAVATVGGGSGNVASALFSTVPGGTGNQANGIASFAAGENARANHAGVFIWGDRTGGDVISTGTNQFIVRAAGGLWLGTNSSVAFAANSFIQTTAGQTSVGATDGARLTSGGAWTNASGRATKADLAEADPRAVLEALAGLPIRSWSYLAEGPGVRHLGPLAEEFRAAFGLGDSDRHITTVDADGVALAAIQGLYRVVQEQEATIAAQQARVAGLEREVAELREAAARQQSIEARLAALEERAGGGR